MGMGTRMVGIVLVKGMQGQSCVGREELWEVGRGEERCWETSLSERLDGNVWGHIRVGTGSSATIA